MKIFIQRNKLLIIFLIIFVIFVFSQDNENYELFDGPHIFYKEDSLIVKYAQDSTSHKFSIKMAEETIFKGFLKDSNTSYIIPKVFNPIPQHYPPENKIFVVSDVHGQYDIFRKLLLKNNVIDSNNSWIWGDGHLVINGDTFDKGANVHECLWLIYNLEQQAKKAGGLVHYLLGNHEIKALRGDLKYVVDKYFSISDILDIPIPELYCDDTFWGRWLRSKNIITKIGNLLFVHGGLHEDIVKEDFSISEINNTMRGNIDLSLEKIKMDTTLSFLFRKYGPLRYRGFFRPDSLPEVSHDQLSTILDHFNVERVVVGHTTNEHIVSTFDNRVIGIDGGIHRGNGGEALLIKNNKYYRANMEGKLLPLFDNINKR